MTVYGTPSANGENVVLVAHALTGSSRVAEWWPALLGPGKLFDTRNWCIIGMDIAGEPTVGDVVRCQREALDQLGIQRAHIVIGASLGGMQALQWALDAPNRIDHAFVIGASDHHTTMGIALNAVQREAIALDPQQGLGLARKIAMLTYKSEELFNERHGRKPDRTDPSRFDIEGYLDHQGDKLVARMDPQTYVARTYLMDRFDLRDREAPPDVEITFVGISSDWLFRPQEIRAAAKRLNARYLELQSDHGHDAFLAEPDKLQALLAPLLTPERSLFC